MEVWGRETTASTASEASLANFCFREPLPLNAKLLVGIVPNPYSERTVLPYRKLQTPHHPHGCVSVEKTLLMSKGWQLTDISSMWTPGT